MYTFWKRTSPPPEMITFDAPDREKCIARRTLTNTPLQELVLLNDTAFVEAARALGQRMMASSDGVSYGFRVATARMPAEREAAVLRGALHDEIEHYRQH